MAIYVLLEFEKGFLCLIAFAALPSIKPPVFAYSAERVTMNCLNMKPVRLKS